MHRYVFQSIITTHCNKEEKDVAYPQCKQQMIQQLGDGIHVHGHVTHHAAAFTNMLHDGSSKNIHLSEYHVLIVSRNDRSVINAMRR